MGCSCSTPISFLWEASRNGLTFGGSWFGLIFKASFPHLGRVVVSHTLQSLGERGVGDGTGSPTSSLEPCGWVGLGWLRAQLKVWPSVAQRSVAVPGLCGGRQDQALQL